MGRCSEPAASPRSGWRSCAWLLVAAATAVATPDAAARRGRIDRVDHAARGEHPSLGPRYAPVTIEFFADLGDGFPSGQLHLLLRELWRRHPSRLRVIYRLTRRTPQFTQHLLAALEAHAQGRFFEFVDELYAGTRSSRRVEDFAAIAERAGLDPARIAAVIDPDVPPAPEREATLRANHYYRQKSRVQRIPGLLINGIPFDRRPSSVEDLEAIYRQSLAEAEARLADGVPIERLLETTRAAGSRAAAGADDAGSIEIDGLEPGDAPPSKRPILVRLDPRRGEVLSGPDGRLTVTLFCNLVTRNCAEAAGTLRELGEAYGPELRVVFRHLYDVDDPEQRWAGSAARAAWCGAAMGRFEAFLDLLLTPRPRGSTPDHELDPAAAESGLDERRFHRCRLSAVTGKALAAELAAARREGVHATPSFVVGGRLFLGTRSLDELSRHVDRALEPGVLDQLDERSAPGLH